MNHRISTLLGFVVYSLSLLACIATESIGEGEDKKKPPKLNHDEFQKQWDAIEKPVHEGSGVIEKSGIRVLCELGEHRTSSQVRLELTLENRTDALLHLRSTASCGCTLGFPETIEMYPNKPIKVRSILRLPAKPGDLTSSIRCFDKEIEFEFTIIFSTVVVGDVAYEPAELKVEEGESIERELFLRPKFDNVHLSSCTASVESGALVVEKVEAEKDGLRMKLKITPPQDNRIVDETVQVSMEGESDKGPVKYSLSIPIRYENRVEVKPYQAIFRKATGFGKGGESHVAILMLMSPRISWEEITRKDIQLTLKGDADGLPPIHIAKLITKKSGATLFLEMDNEDLKQFEKVKDNVRILLSGVSNDWSAEVPFTILE